MYGVFFTTKKTTNEDNLQPGYTNFSASFPFLL